MLFERASDLDYLQWLMEEPQIRGSIAFRILCDDQSCIKLVDNCILHACTKHFEITITYERDYLLMMSISYISIA